MEVGACDKLRCPECRGRLTLEPFATEEHGGRVFVESGVALCEPCRISYPIESGTAVMLRFGTSFHDWFARAHDERLARFAGYSLPHGSPRPGELSVQETFTDEWNLTRESDLSFAYTFNGLVDLNRSVWLRSIADLPPVEKPRTLLDVGCGVGMETMALREATGAEESFGIDLNFALLSRREEYRHLPDVHFVIASLFDLPFERGSFDLVYSQGVLHHTYSTSDAFEAIAPLVRRGGHLFVWVYGLDDHLSPDSPGSQSRSWRRRRNVLEWTFRPLISRCPRFLRDAIFKVLVAGWYARTRLGAALGRGAHHREAWSRENVEHAIRDWLSPRYARRHGYNEVMEWFESAGFEVTDAQSPAAYRKLFSAPLWGVGISGQRREGADSGERDAAIERAEVA
jgi:ubiquinone/menaquinone biosynthesis C-methylase UbiE/uncharacterized protein YbaR (Trm112 family)